MSFTLGNVSAGRDVNMQSQVRNINVNIENLAQELESIASTPQEQQQVAELAQAVEQKDESMISRVMGTIVDNAPFLAKMCGVLFKVLVK